MGVKTHKESKMVDRKVSKWCSPKIVVPLAPRGKNNIYFYSEHRRRAVCFAPNLLVKYLLATTYSFQYT